MILVSKYKVIQTDERMFARSVSFLFWKRIYVGRLMRHLTTPQKEAVIAHEEAHCRYHHSELRFLCLLFAPFLLTRFCHWTEFVADRHAAKRGLGKYLATVLSLHDKKGLLYPSAWQRIKAIQQYESNSRDSRKGSIFARTA